MHSFWDFVLPQKVSCHLIFPSAFPHTSPIFNPLPDFLSPPRDCLLFHLAPSRHPFQCCLLPLPSSFLCQVSQVLVQMSAGSAHTWSSVRSTLHNSESCLLLSLFILHSKTFTLVFLPPSLFYFPIYFCLTKSLVVFFMFLFLAFKSSFFLPVLHLRPLDSLATRLSSMLLVPTTSTV